MSQSPDSSNTEHVRDLNVSPVVERPWTPPLRVFLSYTSELRDHPSDRPFVASAVDAVVRAGHAVVHMGLFDAADTDSTADFCTLWVARCDVYVGIIGLQYGTPVRERPDVSYTELEFETATTCKLPRLIFLIHEDVAPRLRGRRPREHSDRQLAFRRRLRDSGLMVASVTSAHELELRLFRSLVDLEAKLTRSRIPEQGRDEN
jgi:hypothetical protein